MVIYLSDNQTVKPVSSANNQSLQPAKVTHIVDGDTLDVEMANCRIPWRGNPQKCRIRLACLDTPEKGQKPFFNNAKQRLQQLLNPGTIVKIRDTGDSSYNRIVAEIFINQRSINLQMIQEGQGAIYCQYLDNCRSTKSAYLQAEANAKKRGLGIWNPQQPWTGIRENHPCQ
ncbi:nuclease (SNase domain protein) [Rippkaea orientalis PCC 8801]|uniref:Nuclease (SNase domain protein) n=1 Tax=Rippkaea orientalis (strain PCC 8801 / RF-1) TaxID=41431 RepID=B7K2R4_RIPO1|nr:thermonuclease family protein [Rippkaea orientalis]ACK67615.1 nuclease (SNase domain protein) [Rippkaea orientalis PCC 8801]